MNSTATATMPALLGLSLLDWLMIVLAPLPFVDQYRSIAKTRDVGAFNPSVCGILLTCNVLRIFFWVHRRFEVALLYQSGVMVLAQLLMLELCVRSQRLRWRQVGYPRIGSLNDYFRIFWKWPSFIYYIVYLAALTIICGLLGVLLKNQSWYGEALGSLALGTEAMVPVPQAYTNHIQKSTHGLSLAIVAGWFLGDSFKIVYFHHIGAPSQFIFCGIVQFAVDVLICWQIMNYGGSNPFRTYYRKKSSSSTDYPPLELRPLSATMTSSIRTKV